MSSELLDGEEKPPNGPRSSFSPPPLLLLEVSSEGKLQFVCVCARACGRRGCSRKTFVLLVNLKQITFWLTHTHTHTAVISENTAG